MRDDILEFIDEDGNEQELYLIEEAKLNGTNYILVADSEDEETDAYILKDISAPDAEEAEYILVDDDDELDAVLSLFKEMLEDIDFV